MTEYRFTKKQLDNLLGGAMRRTLKQVDSQGIFEGYAHHTKVVKGVAGDIIERSVLGMRKDTRQEPDILVDGTPVEIKVTGVKKLKKDSAQYTAKERLTITHISPAQIITDEFSTSHLWVKLQRTLIVYYHYAVDKALRTSDYENFPLLDYSYLHFSPSEKKIIQGDWEKVKSFYKSSDGKRILSELLKNKDNPNSSEFKKLRAQLSAGLGKLMYLEVAPKWPGPRFALKQSYFKIKTDEILSKTTVTFTLGNISTYEDFIKYLRNATKHYHGKSIKEICEHFEIPYISNTSGNIPKSLSDKILGAMLTGKKDGTPASKIEEFRKAGFIVKSLAVTQRGNRTEDTKLTPVNFEEFDEDYANGEPIKFEDSSIRGYFSESTFVFAVFQESGSGKYEENKFLGLRLLRFDENFIETEVRKTWEELLELHKSNGYKTWDDKNKSGELIYNKNGLVRQCNNFPKAKTNQVFLRGTGQDSSDKPLVLSGQRFYRQDWWIKGTVLVEMLNNIENL